MNCVAVGKENQAYVMTLKVDKLWQLPSSGCFILYNLTDAIAYEWRIPYTTEQGALRRCVSLPEKAQPLKSKNSDI